MAKYNYKIVDVRTNKIRQVVKWLVTNYDAIVIFDEESQISTNYC